MSDFLKNAQVTHTVMVRALKESLSRELDQQLAELRREQIEAIDTKINKFKEKVLQNVVMHMDEESLSGKIHVSFAVDVKQLAKEAGL